ncbi:MAG TPA: D-alanyl-D-alanine carboxypeptidase/D-alanyl-D-alanine-endopeptidase [Sporichthyaceae bacterium]|nr:D-alanyl-D-alanine carboxypeptidase/D-alanyl-D-alanine-endopeptidase [Sporichthyaceae bacterium]
MRGRWASGCLALALTLVAGSAAAQQTPGPQPATPPAATTVEDLTPVLPGQGLAPTAAGLASRLANLLTNSALGPHFGLQLTDVGSGTPLYGVNGNDPFAPASVTKVLTAAATLVTLGPDTRLHTCVMLLPAAATPAPIPPVSPGPSFPPGPSLEPGPPVSPGPTAAPLPERTVVLIGGGDPLLTSLPTGSDELPAYPQRAHLDDLAIQTAQGLRNVGIDRIRLRYDSSFFSGPAASPQWVHSYTSDVVGPVVALSADAGRAQPENEGRVADPAAHTAALFAAQLRQAGVTVLDKPAPQVAPPGVPTIGDVASAPLGAMLEWMLVQSDNDVAEAMARQVAIHDGRPATFTDGAAAVRAEVSKLGVDLTGVTTYDGSGLSREDRIPPRVLAQTLAAAASGPNQVLRVLTGGLAVAGVNGTLMLHFYDPRSMAARGILRAKSGSLQGVVSLTGILPDADGRLLTFAAIADDVAPGEGLAARVAIERIAAALLSCGCR